MESIWYEMNINHRLNIVITRFNGFNWGLALNPRNYVSEHMCNNVSTNIGKYPSDYVYIKGTLPIQILIFQNDNT